MRFLPYAIAAVFMLAASASPSAKADPVRTDHVEVELIAENTGLTRDGDNWLALRIAPEDGWHVYWRNPGDSGLPTSLKWTLPAGFEAGDIEWPYPQRVVLGNIVNYGYDDETLLLVPVTDSADLKPGTPVDLHAKAKWLVCKDVCIPGTADLGLTLPVADGALQTEERWRQAFSKTREKLPQPAPADWKVSFDTSTTGKDKTFSLAIVGANISSANSASFFPYPSDLINHSSPSRKASDEKQGLRITRTLSDFFVKDPEQVDGILVLQDGDSDKAWEIHAQPGHVTAVPMSAAKTEGGAATLVAADLPNLAFVLLLAVLGGLTLNLMPCVFPVLSIKAISLVEARGATARKQRAHAIAYTTGVLLTFLGLAGLLLILRGSGSAIGWGFQLQQPAFVGALAYLFFAMGLSLSGVVEFGTRLMGVGQSLAGRGGYRGSFFTGVLAVAVASPCTAPFMGTALGYALSQPAYVALAVFAALGLGLALPFLVIGFNPALGRLLPRPGQWMETFKQFMAFPLYLTAIWLIWVLGGLTDRNGMVVALLGLTLIAFALWLWNRPGSTAGLLKFAAIIAALALLASPPLQSVPAGTQRIDKNAAFEPWSESRIAELRAGGRTVFVNFTADWCITCKVNEHGALASDSVRKAFADRKVVWLEGDWTRADPAITKTLEQFGRSGVPLYLVYVAGGEPKVLPQILTPDAIVSALGPLPAVEPTSTNKP